MKIRGFTDTEDYNIQTLFWMMARRECWRVGVYWKDWRLQWTYTWYDGPIWQLYVGPLCINIDY